MRHGSLFSGIGGFDLAAEWMGWENVFHCEWNEFGKKILKYYWPKSESLDDITKTDFIKYANKIDILTGGFPCQPYSSAGKRLGKEDERHLWPEMLRAIREIKPKYIVGENVFGLLSWNGGVVFDEVHAQLEFEGYEVQAVVIPAAAVNAPHGRDRVWFVATNANGHAGRCRSSESGCEKRETISNGKPKIYFRVDTDGKKGDVTHTNGDGLHQCNSNDEINSSKRGEHAFNDIKSFYYTKSTIKHPLRFGQKRRSYEAIKKTTTGNEPCKSNARRFKSTDWENFPTQSPICGGDDGISYQLDGITFSKWRAESIKAYGNAIVPQVALQIFKAIIDTEK